MQNWFIMKKYYNSIDAENLNNIQEVNTDPDTNTDTIDNEPKNIIFHCIYRSILECTQTIRQVLVDDRVKMIMHAIGLGIFIIILSFIIAITIGIWVVIINTIFEKTLVFLFGRNIYNKNFPVCTDTQYLGNNCYTSTNTYCS